MIDVLLLFLLEMCHLAPKKAGVAAKTHVTIRYRASVSAWSVIEKIKSVCFFRLIGSYNDI